MKHRRLLAFAMIAAFDISSVDAFAQIELDLTNNDLATIDVTGTHGVVGGSPVANATSSYGVVTVTGHSGLTFGSGATLTGSGYTTSLAIDTSGTVAVTGGTIPGASAGDAIDDSGSGLLIVSGGTINNLYGEDAGIDYYGSGNILISGGTFVGSVYDGDGTPVVSGLTGHTTPGTVYVTGGQFENNTSSGYIGFLAYQGAPIDLFSTPGTGFLIDNGTTPVTSGIISVTPNAYHTIHGTLADGNLLNSTFFCRVVKSK